MSYPWSSINTQAIDVLNNIYLGANPGNDGDTIVKAGSTQVWKKQIGLVSVYYDTTDGIQNVGSSPVDIEFDTVAFNYASIYFSSPNSFKTTIDGIYTIVFECLLSDSSFQSGISISVNGTIVYGNFTTTTSVSNNVPFTMSYTTELFNGDKIKIIGEKVSGGPNYLKTNPLYSTPVTRLSFILN